MAFDFPNSPTVGQVFGNYTWDGEKWVSTASLPSGSVVRSYLAGLTLSTPGGSGSFTVAPGVAADSTNVAMMTLAAAMTKTQFTWTVGNNGGALDTGSISVGSWCHVYLMRRPDTGVVDVAYSLSATAPTTGGNIPAAYTQFRRIGSMKAGTGGFWTAFVQDGDRFMWVTPVSDYAASAVTAAVTVTLVSVPTGVKVRAKLTAGINTTVTAPQGAVYISDLSLADIAPLYSAAASGMLYVDGTASQNVIGAMSVECMTSLAAQVRVRCQFANGGLTIVTYGWKDRRGRDN